MPGVRHLLIDAVLVVVGLLVAAQLVAAAPAAKVGTSYLTTGGATLQNDFVVLAQMDVPAGKYHVTATIALSNQLPQQPPGAEVNPVYCALSVFGVNAEGSEQTTLPAGGFTTLALLEVVDASRASPTAYINVECKAAGATTPFPYAGVVIVADVMSGIVDLR